MHKKTCYIVGAGAFCARGLHPGPQDLLLAADGGYDALNAIGLRPHLLLGDMDSIRSKATGIPRLRFPRHKDDTDMALAIRYARSRGYRRFRLYGAAGGRQDHVQANLQLLVHLAKSRCDARIIDQNFTVYALSAAALQLPFVPAGTTVSVFCVGDSAQGVTLRGFVWDITDARLTGDRPLGVSNRATGGAVSVSVRKGTLLVFVMRQHR